MKKESGKEGKRLYAPSQVKKVMQSFNLHFNKRLGQNFLVDGNRVRQIVQAAGVGPEDTVLEIGPGIGTLTEELLLHAEKVVAIEVDSQLVAALSQIFFSDIQEGRLVLVEGDALKVDIQSLLAEEAGDGRVKLVANLPYYITTPLIRRLLEGHFPFDRLAVLVQQEVADRILAAPSSPDYGSLTLLVQAYAEASQALSLPKQLFMPQPKVDSALLLLDIRRESDPALDPRGRLNQADNQKKLTAVIQRAFEQRRKTVMNALSRAIPLDKPALGTLLDRLGIDRKARPEDLSLRDYLLILEEAGLFSEKE